ncbi:MAG: NINE protein [Verrucomicrobia bacterium]|nr:NINE protein [Verrucomicrobiota bacterium]
MTKTPTHNTAIAYLFWIFGFMGAHRFYFGKPLTGLLWFFTLGFFLIGWIIDLLLIPAMNREASRRFRPGRYDYSLAFLLLWFLGLLGIHRFYLGKPLSGILFLLTGGLFGLGWLYDLCTLSDQVDSLNRSA